MVTGTSTTTTLYFGPQTINVGDLGVCESYPPLTGCTGGTPFVLGEGQSDLDTLTVILAGHLHDHDHDEHRSADPGLQPHWRSACSASAGAPTWTLLGAGLLGLGCVFRQFRRRAEQRSAFRRSAGRSILRRCRTIAATGFQVERSFSR